MNPLKKLSLFGYLFQPLDVLIILSVVALPIAFFALTTDPSSKIAAGMSEADVIKLLGKPTQVWQGKDSPDMVFWFGKTGRLQIENPHHAFIYYEGIDYTRVVTFDQSGNVKEYHHGGT